MNRKQLVALWIGVAAAAAVLVLVPPGRRAIGTRPDAILPAIRHPVYAPDDHTDRLLWLAVTAAGTVAAVITLGAQERRAP